MLLLPCQDPPRPAVLPAVTAFHGSGVCLIPNPSLLPPSASLPLKTRQDPGTPTLPGLWMLHETFLILLLLIPQVSAPFAALSSKIGGFGGPNSHMHPCQAAPSWTCLPSLGCPGCGWLDCDCQQNDWVLPLPTLLVLWGCASQQCFMLGHSSPPHVLGSQASTWFAWDEAAAHLHLTKPNSSVPVPCFGQRDVFWAAGTALPQCLPTARWLSSSC